MPSVEEFRKAREELNRSASLSSHNYRLLAVNILEDYEGNRGIQLVKWTPDGTVEVIEPLLNNDDEKTLLELMALKIKEHLEDL